MVQLKPSFAFMKKKKNFFPSPRSSSNKRSPSKTLFRKKQNYNEVNSSRSGSPDDLKLAFLDSSDEEEQVIERKHSPSDAFPKKGRNSTRPNREEGIETNDGGEPVSPFRSQEQDYEEIFGIEPSFRKETSRRVLVEKKKKQGRKSNHQGGKDDHVRRKKTRESSLGVVKHKKKKSTIIKTDHSKMSPRMSSKNKSLTKRKSKADENLEESADEHTEEDGKEKTKTKRKKKPKPRESMKETPTTGKRNSKKQKSAAVAPEEEEVQPRHHGKSNQRKSTKKVEDDDEMDLPKRKEPPKGKKNIKGKHKRGKTLAPPSDDDSSHDDSSSSHEDHGHPAHLEFDPTERTALWIPNDSYHEIGSPMQEDILIFKDTTSESDHDFYMDGNELVIDQQSDKDSFNENSDDGIQAAPDKSFPTPCDQINSFEGQAPSTREPTSTDDVAMQDDFRPTTSEAALEDIPAASGDKAMHDGGDPDACEAAVDDYETDRSNEPFEDDLRPNTREIMTFHNDDEAMGSGIDPSISETANDDYETDGSDNDGILETKRTTEAVPAKGDLRPNTEEHDDINMGDGIDPSISETAEDDYETDGSDNDGILETKRTTEAEDDGSDNDGILDAKRTTAVPAKNALGRNTKTKEHDDMDMGGGIDPSINGTAEDDYETDGSDNDGIVETKRTTEAEDDYETDGSDNDGILDAKRTTEAVPAKNDLGPNTEEHDDVDIKDGIDPSISETAEDDYETDGSDNDGILDAKGTTETAPPKNDLGPNTKERDDTDMGDGIDPSISGTAKDDYETDGSDNDGILETKRTTEAAPPKSDLGTNTKTKEHDEMDMGGGIDPRISGTAEDDYESDGSDNDGILDEKRTTEAVPVKIDLDPNTKEHEGDIGDGIDPRISGTAEDDYETDESDNDGILGTKRTTEAVPARNDLGLNTKEHDGDMGHGIDPMISGTAEDDYETDGSDDDGILDAKRTAAVPAKSDLGPNTTERDDTDMGDGIDPMISGTAEDDYEADGNDNDVIRDAKRTTEAVPPKSYLGPSTKTKEHDDMDIGDGIDPSFSGTAEDYYETDGSDNDGILDAKRTTEAVPAKHDLWPNTKEHDDMDMGGGIDPSISETSEDDNETDGSDNDGILDAKRIEAVPAKNDLGPNTKEHYDMDMGDGIDPSISETREDDYETDGSVNDGILETKRTPEAAPPKIEPDDTSFVPSSSQPVEYEYESDRREDKNDDGFDPSKQEPAPESSEPYSTMFIKEIREPGHVDLPSGVNDKTVHEESDARTRSSEYSDMPLDKAKAATLEQHIASTSLRRAMPSFGRSMLSDDEASDQPRQTNAAMAYDEPSDPVDLVARITQTIATDSHDDSYSSASSRDPQFPAQASSLKHENDGVSNEPMPAINTEAGAEDISHGAGSDHESNDQFHTSEDMELGKACDTPMMPVDEMDAANIMSAVTIQSGNLIADAEKTDLECMGGNADLQDVFGELSSSSFGHDVESYTSALNMDYDDRPERSRASLELETLPEDPGEATDGEPRDVQESRASPELQNEVDGLGDSSRHSSSFDRDGYSSVSTSGREGKDDGLFDASEDTVDPKPSSDVPDNMISDDKSSQTVKNTDFTPGEAVSVEAIQDDDSIVAVERRSRQMKGVVDWRKVKASFDNLSDSDSDDASSFIGSSASDTSGSSSEDESETSSSSSESGEIPTEIPDIPAKAWPRVSTLSVDGNSASESESDSDSNSTSYQSNSNRIEPIQEHAPDDTSQHGDGIFGVESIFKVDSKSGMPLEDAVPDDQADQSESREDTKGSRSEDESETSSSSSESGEIPTEIPDIAANAWPRVSTLSVGGNSASESESDSDSNSTSYQSNSNRIEPIQEHAPDDTSQHGDGISGVESIFKVDSQPTMPLQDGGLDLATVESKKSFFHTKPTMKSGYSAQHNAEAGNCSPEAGLLKDGVSVLISNVDDGYFVTEAKVFEHKEHENASPVNYEEMDDLSVQSSNSHERFNAEDKARRVAETLAPRLKAEAQAEANAKGTADRADEMAAGDAVLAQFKAEEEPGLAAKWEAEEAARRKAETEAKCKVKEEPRLESVDEIGLKAAEANLPGKETEKLNHKEEENASKVRGLKIDVGPAHNGAESIEQSELGDLEIDCGSVKSDAENPRHKEGRYQNISPVGDQEIDNGPMQRSNIHDDSPVSETEIKLLKEEENAFPCDDSEIKYGSAGISNVHGDSPVNDANDLEKTKEIEASPVKDISSDISARCEKEDNLLRYDSSVQSARKRKEEENLLASVVEESDNLGKKHSIEIEKFEKMIQSVPSEDLVTDWNEKEEDVASPKDRVAREPASTVHRESTMFDEIFCNEISAIEESLRQMDELLYSPQHKNKEIDRDWAQAGLAALGCLAEESHEQDEEEDNRNKLQDRLSLDNEASNHGNDAVDGFSEDDVAITQLTSDAPMIIRGVDTGGLVSALNVELLPAYGDSTDDNEDDKDDARKQIQALSQEANDIFHSVDFSSEEEYAQGDDVKKQESQACENDLEVLENSSVSSNSDFPNDTASTEDQYGEENEEIRKPSKLANESEATSAKVRDLTDKSDRPLLEQKNKEKMHEENYKFFVEMVLMLHPNSIQQEEAGQIVAGLQQGNGELLKRLVTTASKAEKVSHQQLEQRSQDLDEQLSAAQQKYDKEQLKASMLEMNLAEHDLTDLEQRGNVEAWKQKYLGLEGTFAALESKYSQEVEKNASVEGVLAKIKETSSEQEKALRQQTDKANYLYAIATTMEEAHTQEAAQLKAENAKLRELVRIQKQAIFQAMKS